MPDIDVYLVAGQSNAEGRGNSSLSPAVDPALGYEYNGAAVLSLADPVGGATSGSAWPAFANAVLAARPTPLCITEGATGGTALMALSGSDNWAVGSSNFDHAVSRATGALAALGLAGWTPTLRAVLWHQGESDALFYPSPSRLQADYATALLDLHDRFKAALGAVPMCVFRLGRPNSGDTAGFASVRAAQEVACAARPDMHMVYRGCVGFPAAAMMTDDLHYNQDGYNLMGAGGGGEAASILYRQAIQLRVNGQYRTAVARLNGTDRAVSEIRVVQ